MFVVEDEEGIATIIYYQQTVKQIEFIQEAALPKTSKVSISIINKKQFFPEKDLTQIKMDLSNIQMDSSLSSCCRPTKI